MSRKTNLDVWDMNSDWTDWCRTLLVKATSISSFCCSANNKPWQRSRHFAKTVNFKSDQISLHISLKWLDIQHNWLEIVVQLLSWARSVYLYHSYILKFWITTYMNVSPLSIIIYEHFCIFSVTSIFSARCFSKNALYFEHDVATQSLYILSTVLQRFCA